MFGNIQLFSQDFVSFDVFYDTIQCEPVQVTLNNYSSFSIYTGPVTYNWYLNNELHSTEQYPTTFELQAGHYDIRLEALDTLSNNLGEFYQSIYVKGFTGMFNTFPQFETAPGQPVQFYTNDNHQWVIFKLHTGDVLKHNWSQYIYNTVGTYPVKMSISGECGLDTVTQWITVSNSAVPGAEIMVSNYEVCPNDELILTSNPAFLNEWTIGGTTLTGREIFFAFGDLGNHEVILKNTNEYGNSSYDTAYINVRNDIPVFAEFEPFYESAPCPNNQIKFEAFSSGTFDWDFGDGSTGFGKRVYNTFVDTGLYNVTLYATNGCGTQDTVTQEVYINYGEFSFVPFPEFYFANRENGWEPTITICPYEVVTIINQTSQEEGVNFTWIIDSVEYYQKEVTHIFSEPGMHEIKLIAQNNCMATNINSKWVYVDTILLPDVNLNFAPLAICPGEKVYFFDDKHKSTTGGPTSITYSIDFGDGNIINNITNPSGDEMEFLSVHTYTTPAVYNVVFTATNNCGNTDTLLGQVDVSNDPNRIPFYYTHNTSTSDELESEFEDWSVIPNKQFTTFNINVDLFDWNYCGPMDSIAYILFWYGNFDINNPDLGPPNGYVELTAPGTAVAYIPFNVVKPSVGLAAAWYCNKNYFEKDPQVFSIPFDSIQMANIQSFPTIPGENFVLPQTLVLNGMQWMSEQSCICTPPSNKLKGNWNYKTNEGYYNFIDIYEIEGGSLEFNASSGTDPWDGNKTQFQYGSVVMINDTTLELQASSEICTEPGIYHYSVSTDNHLTFTLVNDNCSNRTTFLTQSIFDKTEYENYNSDIESGCPGDTIGFEVIGGIAYEWHIQGNVTTDPFAYYVYADSGVYEEFVVTTNSCGRNDTIYTKVIIGMDNLPNANWEISRWSAKRFEPLQFTTYSNSKFKNNNYLWNFGDGIYSTEENPSHFYTVEGEYLITLTVTNGCGSSSEQKTIYITKETSVCEAKFIYTTLGQTVTFQNKSLGNISSYYWELGDGKVSKLPNPTNTYPADGIYMVSLTIYDSVNNCTNQIQKQILVGTVGCAANFNYTVNNVSRTVSFNNLSSGNITEYYWNFGDGDFSTSASPLHTYSVDGNYTVCLVTYDEGTQCMSEICKLITVGTPEIFADFSYYIDPTNSKVNLRDISTGNITNWYWDFGDGTWDTIPEPQHTYAESGEYNVCLSVFNNLTGYFTSVCKTIIVVADTSSTATKANFTYFVNPTTRKIDFTDQSTGEITNWYWTFGDGTYESGENVSHTYLTAGLYNVCLIVYNSNTGERSEICKIIQVGIIDCNINADFSYYINPTLKQVSFSNKTTGTAHKWFWDFGNGKTSTSKNPVHTYTSAGFYLVSLAVRDTINGCNDYYADFIQVGTADCKADFNFTITDITNNSVKFTDKSIGNIENYFWYFNDGYYSTEKDPLHSFGSGGLYSVSLTVADNSGLCFDYRVKDVQVGTIDCNADFTYYIDSTTNTAYFTNEVLGTSTSIYWLFGDGSYFVGSNPTHNYVAPGYYNVSLNTFNSGNGCMDYDEKVVLIGSPGDDVEADFIYQADFSTKEVTFINKSQGENLNFLWDFGDGTTSTLENPVITYLEGGYKFVCLTVTNSLTDAQKITCKLVQVSDDNATNCLAKFNYDVDSTNLTVQFADKSYGTPNQFTWSFGDGTSSTTQNPLKVYSEPGYYMVVLSAKNTGTGCVSTEYNVLNVGAGSNGIQAMFTYFVDTTSKGKPGGKPVDIIGVGHGGGSNLSWSYGDKKVESGKVTESTLRPTHIYENPGIYNCCLTIEDLIINQSDTYCNNIMIPYETLVSESICEGTEYDFLGNMLSVAGEYVDTTTSVNGVDSIVYLTLSVNSSPDKPTANLTGTTLTSSATTGNQWYFNGTLISGATNQTYQATQSGNYTVIVTDINGCSSESSDEVNVVISGIEDVESFSLKVFPNPLQSHTRIEYYLSDTKQIKIALYDVSGNLIETIINTYKPAGNHYIIWKNPGLANGIYYMVMVSENEKITTKLVIQK